MRINSMLDDDDLPTKSLGVELVPDPSCSFRLQFGRFA